MCRIGLTTLAVSMLALGATGAAAQSLALDLDVGPTGPVVRGAADCAGGEIYDDGTVESGYSGNHAVVSSFEAVQQFTPAAYPGTYDTVCIALSGGGGSDLDLEIEVRDDDGPSGSPGTLLGTVAVSAAGIPIFPEVAFYSYDITSLGISIPAGSVWIGVRWNPMDFPGRFIGADETAASPLHPGFVNLNLGDGWQATETVFQGYRAKVIRAIPGVLEADLEITKSGEAELSEITWTIEVSNNGPDDATGVVVTDALDACTTFVSDACGGSDVPPWTWNIGSLPAGADAVCNVVVDGSGCGVASVSNTATVAGNESDPVPANDSASVEIDVGSVLEIPTLGETSLLVLGLLMAAGAVWKLRNGS